MRRDEAVSFLLKHPYKLGHLVGFTRLGELHNDWMKKMLTGKDDMTLQAHRNSYKTTCVSIVLAIIVILLPNKRTMFIRKTDNDVKEIIEQVKKILLSPQMVYFVHSIYGINLKLTTDNSGEISTNLTTDSRGTSQLVGMGIGGSLTGKHFDFIFTDDIVNLKDRKSKAERDQTRAIVQELQNIKEPNGGRIINTGTPWHKDDAFELMPPAEKYDCYTTGILSKEKIEELRQTMAPSLFAANYELRHIAVENALFITPPTFTDDKSLLRDGIAHVDAAYGGEDYTAFTCGKRVGDKLYMYGRMWHSHVDTVLDVALKEATRLMCSPVWCEDNGDKGFLAKEIQHKGQLARKYHEKENKYFKISTFLRKWWNNIVWLEGTDKEYLNQIMDYTEDAEHDDAPDSASVVCRYYDKRSGEPYQSLITGQLI